MSKDEESDINMLNELLKAIKNESEDVVPIPKVSRNSTMIKINQITSLFVSGVVIKTLINPFERIKVLQQTGTIWRNNANIEKFDSKGAFSLFSEIKQKQGLSGLLKGNSINLYKIIPLAILRLTIYENLKSLFLFKGDYFHHGFDLYIRKSATAFIASMVTNAFLYPMERARVILFLDMNQPSLKAKKNTMTKTIRNIVKHDGFRGLYRGYLLNCLGIVPFNISALLSYDLYRDMIKDEDSVTMNTKLTILGLLSTLSATLVCHPIDTIRRNLQADSRVNSSTFKFKGAVNCLRTLSSTGGIASLYNGLPITLMRLPPSLLLQIYLYESLKKSLFDSLIY